jgi:hypothetical protein
MEIQCYFDGKGIVLVKGVVLTLNAAKKNHIIN